MLVHARFLTPLRLKHENVVARRVPELHVLVQRIVGRVVSLVPLSRPGGLFAAGERSALLATLESARLARRPEVAWQDWERYSARQRDTMPFGGLTGSAMYACSREVALAARPWLGLAGCVGVGSKTTFGLGQVEFSFESEAG